MPSPDANVRSSAERVRFAAILPALPETEFRYSTDTIILCLIALSRASDWTMVFVGPSVLAEYKGAIGAISSPWSPA